MKTDLCCPHCQAQEFIYCPSVTDTAPGFVGGTTDLALQREMFASPAGFLEAYVCNKCGCTQFFVKDLNQLRSKSAVLRFNSGADRSIESSHALNLLKKRVQMLVRLAAPNDETQADAQSLLTSAGETRLHFYASTFEALQQFLNRAADDEDKAVVMNLIETAKSLEAEFDER